jgi:glutathione synthase/RimK-type ligase-like ATP-grasp enzyme
MMRVAIHKNDKIFNHSTTWGNYWIEICEKNNLSYEVVDCYDNNTLDILKNFDCLLWHFNNYSIQDMMFARTILNSVKRLGLKVFPDFNTSWHFDDKIAETYLLNSVEAPIPQSWMFYTLIDCVNWLNTFSNFPIVAKLRCGSGASNVKLIRNRNEAVAYAKRMFNKGFKTAPSVIYKTKSNVKSAKDWETIKKRFKRIPDFIETLKNARKFPNEKGYVYFQEFIPNDGYDIKIVVIGDKLSYIVRNVRQGDFRASGGGELYFNKELVNMDIIKSAFATSDKLGFQCMGYDYVIDNRDGKGKIVEISYGFSHTSLLLAEGYFDRNGVWYNVPLNAPIEVIKSLLGDKNNLETEMLLSK